ncbi:MAG: hypothetical protein DDT40_01800 [candidate division WS2 bacterium]|nr:hypothetical protein [Candidatus Psychracetigena formicireducens]
MSTRFDRGVIPAGGLGEVIMQTLGFTSLVYFVIICHTLYKQLSFILLTYSINAPPSQFERLRN